MITLEIAKYFTFPKSFTEPGQGRNIAFPSIVSWPVLFLSSDVLQKIWITKSNIDALAIAWPCLINQLIQIKFSDLSSDDK